MEGQRSPEGMGTDRKRPRKRVGWRAVLVLLGAIALVLAVQLRAALADGDAERGFPVLETPGRPVPASPASGPVVTPTGTEAAPSAEAAEDQVYRLGVGDEVRVAVLSQPALSGIVKVRPDGALTTPGAGTVHALGRTPEEVGREIEEKLAKILRYPHVDLVVTNYGEQRIFVMGEVDQPGDKPFYKGISALQAVAQCGGIRETGRRTSVLVLRRTAQDEMQIHRLDLGAALDGEKSGGDLALRPYDIVYVPKSFIANLNDFVDQYVRQMVAPFTLYLEGWKAFNIGTSKVKVVTTP